MSKAVATKPAKKRRFKARYLVLLASFVLVLASLLWIVSNTPATVAIPKVAGQTVAESKENLKKANFEIVKKRQNQVTLLKQVVSFERIQMQVHLEKKELKLTSLSLLANNPL